MWRSVFYSRFCNEFASYSSFFFSTISLIALNALLAKEFLSILYVDLNKLYYIDFYDTGCKLDDIDYSDTDSNDVPLTEIMRGFTFDSSISNFSYSSCTDF